MRQPRYPLEALAELRRRTAEAATRRLAGAIRTRDAAARARLAAEEAQHEHERAAARVRDAEREALQRGELRAADLASGEAWGVRVMAEHARLRAGVERTKTAEITAAAVELEAQTTLASRRGEADVVAKDRARWEDARRRSTEARDEEAASEAWRPGAAGAPTSGKPKR